MSPPTWSSSAPSACSRRSTATGWCCTADRDRLLDIVHHARIAAGIAQQGYDIIRADEVQRLALERALFIIGEAAANLSKDVRAAIDQPWRDIIALRNVLAHRYARVDLARLVGTVSERLPELLVAVEAHVEDAR